MDRRVAFALILALTASTAARAALPKRAGLAYAVSGQWEKALDALDPKSADSAERYFRALTLIETGRVVEGLDLLAKLSASRDAFGVAALEKIADHAFHMGRYQYLVDTVGMPVGVKFGEPDEFNYRLGQSLFLIGRTAPAKTYLGKVESHELKPYAMHSLALVAFSEGDYSASIEMLGKALDLMQYVEDPALRIALGDRLRLLRGRIIYHATTVGQVDAENKAKLYKLGISQLALIKPESPFYAEAMRTIGWCSLEMNDTVRAIASFETATGADPDNAHEDIWATGRVFERLGFHDEAADSYAKAGVAARKTAEALTAESRAPFVITPAVASTAWGRVKDRLDNVRGMLGRLLGSLSFVQEVAKGRAATLDGEDVALSTLLGRIDGTAEELDVMSKDLYRYLDSMPIYSLFPKKERARVAAVMDNRERVAAELNNTQAALMALERTRSWNNTSEQRRLEVKALWERLNAANSAISQAETEFLEGVKKRVSVRERELAGLLDDKKRQNEELRPMHAANVALVAREREKHGETAVRIDALRVKIEGVAARVDALAQAFAQAMEEDYRARALARAVELQNQADRYALDEAQALHRKKGEKSGDSDK